MFRILNDQIIEYSLVSEKVDYLDILPETLASRSCVIFGSLKMSILCHLTSVTCFFFILTD